MLFPMTKNWLTFKRMPDGSYRVRDHLEGRSYIVSRRIAALARKLDGKTEPSGAGCGFSDAECEELLLKMEKLHMLRRSKTIFNDKSIHICSLIFPKLSLPVCAAAYIFDLLIRYTWLPLLVFALVRWKFQFSLFQSGSALLGYMLGCYILDPLFHKLARAAACIRVRGRVFEFGYILVRFLPVLYCMSDISNVRKEKDRIHFLMAGTEARLFLAALCLNLAFFWHSADRILLFMFIAIALSALINLIPTSIIQTDGYMLITELNSPGSSSGFDDILALKDFIESQDMFCSSLNSYTMHNTFWEK